MITALVAFLAVFSLLVFVHEFGHFLAAKRSGVRVEEFGFGFPPRLLVLGHWGETVVTINAIPLGGFVRLTGEDDPSLLGSFARQGPGTRAFILVAGVGMNFVLAAVLFSLAAFIGEPVPDSTAVRITNMAPGSPASAVGLRVGDLVLSIDGRQVFDTTTLVRYTQGRLGQEVTLIVQRDGEELTFLLTPRPDPPPGEGPMGIAIETLVTSTRLESHPLWEAIPIGVERTFMAVEAIVFGVTLMVRGLITPDVAGPIGIAQITGEVAQLGLSQLMQFTAFLSVNLALLNLLPFPGLDGGRLAFVVLEVLRGGKRVDPQREGLIHFIGMAILVGLILVVSYFDILRATGQF